MPHVDGGGLIRALRAAGTRIPLVMISGSVTEGSELPVDVRREIAVRLSKDADASQILAGMVRVCRRSSLRQRPLYSAQRRMPLRFERRVDPFIGRTPIRVGTRG